MDNRSTPLLGHPLELIPFFRRWPPSVRRNLLYTLIWSCGLGALLTWLEALLKHDRTPLLEYLLPLLLISNLIGFMIHGGSMLASRLTGGWSRRARGLPRLMFSIALVGASVLLGLGLGNAVLRGKSLFELLANRGILLQSLALAVSIALVMYWVRGSAEKRFERALEASRQKELMASTARLLAEARLRALQAQIEPHFLYNTLANVVSLIGPKPAQAQHMLERFIDYLRASLASSRSEEATLDTETKLVAAYLDVLAVRMGERLRYHIELPDELRQFVIAPMLLQPVVENAVSHGLEPKVEGGELHISARREGKALLLEVRDTGAGLSQTSAAGGTQFGLHQVRERLAARYGANATFTLTDHPDGGTVARITLLTTP